MSSAENLQGFYFQGSVKPQDLASPIFAFRNATHQWELVGVIVKSGGRLETRGQAIGIDYILKVIDSLEQ